MKTVLIVRHAKSSWATPGQPDFDRPLNERGERDAPEMANRLKKRKIKIDRFISSPAKRAKQTCKAFCKVYDVDTDKIVYADKLYHAPRAVFYEVISGQKEKDDSIALFSHNPGITDFVNSLCPDVYIDNMPTCAVFAVKCDIRKWEDFRDKEKSFEFFDFPKSV